MIFRRYPYAGITDTKMGPCIGNRTLNRYPAALRCEFYSVAEKVIQNLLEAYTICLHYERRTNTLIEAYRFCSRQRSDAAQDFIEDIDHINLLKVQFDLACFDFAEVEDIVNKVQQVKSIPMNVVDESILLVIERSPLFPRRAVARIQ